MPHFAPSISFSTFLFILFNHCLLSSARKHPIFCPNKTVTLKDSWTLPPGDYCLPQECTIVFKIPEDSFFSVTFDWQMFYSGISDASFNSSTGSIKMRGLNGRESYVFPPKTLAFQMSITQPYDSVVKELVFTRKDLDYGMFYENMVTAEGGPFYSFLNTLETGRMYIFSTSTTVFPILLIWSESSYYDQFYSRVIVFEGRYPNSTLLGTLYTKSLPENSTVLSLYIAEAPDFYDEVSPFIVIFDPAVFDAYASVRVEYIPDVGPVEILLDATNGTAVLTLVSWYPRPGTPRANAHYRDIRIIGMTFIDEQAVLSVYGDYITVPMREKNLIVNYTAANCNSSFPQYFDEMARTFQLTSGKVKMIVENGGHDMEISLAVFPGWKGFLRIILFSSDLMVDGHKDYRFRTVDGTNLTYSFTWKSGTDYKFSYLLANTSDGRSLTFYANSSSSFSIVSAALDVKIQGWFFVDVETTSIAPVCPNKTIELEDSWTLPPGNYCLPQECTIVFKIPEDSFFSVTFEWQLFSSGITDVSFNTSTTFIGTRGLKSRESYVFPPKTLTFRMSITQPYDSVVKELVFTRKDLDSNSFDDYEVAADSGPFYTFFNYNLLSNVKVGRVSTFSSPTTVFPILLLFTEPSQYNIEFTKIIVFEGRYGSYTLIGTLQSLSLPENSTFLSIYVAETPVFSGGSSPFLLIFDPAVFDAYGSVRVERIPEGGPNEILLDATNGTAVLTLFSWYPERDDIPGPPYPHYRDIRILAMTFWDEQSVLSVYGHLITVPMKQENFIVNYTVANCNTSFPQYFDELARTFYLNSGKVKILVENGEQEWASHLDVYPGWKGFIRITFNSHDIFVEGPKPYTFRSVDGSNLTFTFTWTAGTDKQSSFYTKTADGREFNYYSNSSTSFSIVSSNLDVRMGGWFFMDVETTSISSDIVMPVMYFVLCFILVLP